MSTWTGLNRQRSQKSGDSIRPNWDCNDISHLITKGWAMDLSYSRAACFRRATPSRVLLAKTTTGKSKHLSIHPLPRFTRSRGNSATPKMWERPLPITRRARLTEPCANRFKSPSYTQVPSSQKQIAGAIICACNVSCLAFSSVAWCATRIDFEAS